MNFEQLLSGEIIELKGSESGPKSLILVGVHGNEYCGVEAVKQLLPTLQINAGTVFIGVGNPKAVDQKSRFLEANLNRMFKDDGFLSDSEKRSYEYSQAQTLKAYMEKSEVLLDIHASATLESKVFAICEDNASDIARYLPVDLVVSGFDSVEPGGTDYYMNKIGKVGICVECGYLGDELSTEIAKEAIVSFLSVRGHIESPILERTQQKIHMNSLYLTKTDSFVLAKDFKDFEEVEKGTLIGSDGVEKIYSQSDGIILFARNRNKTGEEAFLFGTYI